MKLPEDIAIGLEDNQRSAVAAVLARVLANQHVLYMKMRNFHWNLTGTRFHTLHEFYEKEYESLARSIDQTAERIRMIGAAAPGSMASMLELASLKEAEGALVDGDASIKALVSDHESVIRELRDVIEKVEDEHQDVGTADFLTALIQSHEESAWMLRSFLHR